MAVEADRFLEMQAPIIDVRSPSEYQRGHICDSQNVPLFSDSERAEVGTLYKKQGRDVAMHRGVALAEPKIHSWLSRLSDISPEREVRVHCWRGGLRSRRFAELLESHNFRPTVLQGGYKAYRKEVRERFLETRKIVILSGLTGSGKTQILEQLYSAGEQVIDLEALANHRGSAFGGIGQGSQPTVEQFENELFEQWRNYDPNRVLWLESENQRIGNVFIPKAIWAQMLEAPAIFLNVDRQSRIDFLLKEYGSLDSSGLVHAFGKIKKRLGGLRYNQALASLENGNLKEAISISLEYYDKAYKRSGQSTRWINDVEYSLPTAGKVETLSSLQQMAKELSAQT